MVFDAGAQQFHCAGIWRDSAEWGNVYSMMMTESAGVVQRIHDRMPVVIKPSDYGVWLSGTVDEATALFVPFDGLLDADPTADLWVKR